MTDRNIAQINHNLDQVLAIAAENTRSIAELRVEISQSMTELRQGIAETATTVRELATYSRNRTQQHDLELDDHDERIERLERDHTEHADRMAKLENIQADIRSMMQMLTRRLSGEPPTE
jgi:predicted RNase H-like nuclease (RuvC/YqgF family)